MSTAFQSYFAQRVKHLFNHLHDFELNGDEVSLHDFRVEMKKLRAIIKFLRTIYSKQKLRKVTRDLRTIFQEAGEIREYQLMQQWIRKTALTSFETAYFPPEELTQLTAHFHQQAAATKQLLKDIVEQVGKYVQVTNQILAEQYVVDLHAHIEKGIRKQPAQEDWHELRKLLKQWIYAVNWVGKEEDVKMDGDLAHYNKLQEAIGYWHDAAMIKDSLYQKQIYLSRDIDIQKDFSKAAEKLNQSLRYRERQVGEMLSRKETTLV